MKYALLCLVPFALAVAAVAQDQDDRDSISDLVTQLADESYEVREEATRALIERGQDAVPALEKALKSDDFEVRFRAGRALRAIRGKPAAGAPKPERPPVVPGAQSQQRSVSVQMLPGKVRVEVREVVDGEVKTNVYEAPTLEELKRKHPEVAEKLPNLQFRTGRPGDMDMDRFWQEWGQGFPDDWWKDLHEELQRDTERLERWRKRILEQQQRAQENWRSRWSRDDGRLLGVRGARPSPALDAQLRLRGKGFVIMGVEKETPADRLGLERFDVLLELNGVAIRHAQDVSRVMRDRKEGAPLQAKVLRTGEPLDLPAAK